MMKSIELAAIRLYQQTLSPLLGPICRYEPSCSHYAAKAIDRFGAIHGTWLTAKRLARCHPWTASSGYDPVPESRNDSLVRHR